MSRCIELWCNTTFKKNNKTGLINVIGEMDIFSHLIYLPLPASLIPNKSVRKILI